MLCVATVPGGFNPKIDKDRLGRFLRDTLREQSALPNCEPLAALTRSYQRCMREAESTGIISAERAKQIAFQELKNERRNARRQMLVQAHEGDQNDGA